MQSRSEKRRQPGSANGRAESTAAASLSLLMFRSALARRSLRLDFLHDSMKSEDSARLDRWHFAARENYDRQRLSLLLCDTIPWICAESNASTRAAKSRRPVPIYPKSRAASEARLRKC